MTGSMNIIMVTSMSGSRGDDVWPPIYGKLRVGTAEAEHLIRNGIAVADPDQTDPGEVQAPPAEDTPVTSPAAEWPPAAETAVVPETDVEKRDEPESPLSQVAPRRGPGRPRKDSLPS